jgi:hypothetical protein
MANRGAVQYIYPQLQVTCQKSNYQFLSENVIYFSYISGIPMVSTPEIDSRNQHRTPRFSKVMPKSKTPISPSGHSLMPCCSNAYQSKPCGCQCVHNSSQRLCAFDCEHSLSFVFVPLVTPSKSHIQYEK